MILKHTPDPEKRPDCLELLKHPFFANNRGSGVLKDRINECFILKLRQQANKKEPTDSLPSSPSMLAVFLSLRGCGANCWPKSDGSNTSTMVGANGSTMVTHDMGTMISNDMNTIAIRSDSDGDDSDHLDPMTTVAVKTLRLGMPRLDFILHSSRV